MKHTLYFPHDIGSRNDPKIQKLLKNHGYEALGLYWCIVEMLYENDGQLNMDEIETYAFSLNCESKLLKVLFTESGLFQRRKKVVFSKSQILRMNAIKEKSAKASISASARWSDTNAMRTHNERNADAMLKINKINKEKKRKTITNVIEKSQRNEHTKP